MAGERPPPDTAQAGEWYQSIIHAPGEGPNGYLLYAGTTPLRDPCGVGGYGPGRTSNPCDRMHYWSLHRGGANFLYADGAVRFLAYTTRGVLPAALTRSAGEVVEIP
jgi:prepilin-type processing-associated H-X9-DG protein